MKRIVVYQILIFSTMLLSFLVTLFVYTYDYFDPNFDLDLSFFLTLFFSLIAILGFGFYILLYKIFNERLKLIYRIIYDSKNPNRGKKITLDGDAIKGAYDEVFKWNQKRESEVAALKEQEVFRREFIGNVSHELKTPVFTVQGYLLTLLDGGLEDPRVNRKFLERANSGVERMAKILEDLDTINNIELGNIDLHITTFNIVDLAKEIIDELEILALEKKITLKLGKASITQLNVKADRNKIAQVLTNLISNSIHYGKENGETILRFIEVDNTVLVEVADNGEGIAIHDLSRLHERFFRVEKSRDRNKGGSGLGLSIVKHIIESHGQSVNVRSTIGVGSTFSFMLAKS